MSEPSRVRRLAGRLLLSVVPLLAAACDVSNSVKFPNTTFDPHSEFGRVSLNIWNIELGFGTAVFVLVEALLFYTVIKFRHRAGAPDPKPVHGNTALEIAWTAIPAIVLVFIAVPTIKGIFETQAKASADALQVEVWGHQWWWEFRYPQYNVTTANELYLPSGRKVNFVLRTKDVLHSFWIPQMGGKRDLITNRTNYLWFTPDSALNAAWNGTCNEYCGASHGNMRFRVFTVPPSDFEKWAAHQALPSVFPAASASTAPTAATLVPVAQTAPAPADAGYVFPADKLPAYVIPDTPIPAAETFATGLKGDAATGFKTFSSQACIGCHTIKGNPIAMGIVGPNLTHVATRHTIGAGLYPNDLLHLEYWVKNAHAMKPGVLMPVLGKDEVDPETGAKSPTGTLTDQQIADIVAYLQELK